MFSESKKDKQALSDKNTSQNIIANGTKIKGDFFSESVIRIDGEIEGNLTSKGKIVLGRTGKIIGNIESPEAYVEGFISGIIKVNGLLTLKSSAKVEGEVSLTKLEVEPGALFNVTCTMGNGGSKHKNSKEGLKNINANSHKNGETEKPKQEKIA